MPLLGLCLDCLYIILFNICDQRCYPWLVGPVVPLPAGSCVHVPMSSFGWPPGLPYLSLGHERGQQVKPVVKTGANLRPIYSKPFHHPRWYSVPYLSLGHERGQQVKPVVRDRCQLATYLQQALPSPWLVCSVCPY